MTREYPSDFEQFLERFFPNNRDQIRRDYNRKYDHRILSIEKNIREKLENDIFSRESHNKFMNCAIIPFIEPYSIDPQYQLIFIDFLYYSKYVLRNFSDVLTFDLVIAKINGNTIKTLIFIEVKSGSARGAIKLSDIQEYETNVELRNQIFAYISDKAPDLKIAEDIKFEYVLAVQHSRIKSARTLIRDNEIPVIIWDITLEYKSNSYTIDIIDEEITVNIANNTLYSKHSDNRLAHVLSQNKLKSIPIFFLCPSVDIQRIIEELYSYFKSEGKEEISQKIIRKILFNVGLGQYYDDEEIFPFFYNNLIKFGLNSSIIKKVQKKHYWKRVNFLEKLFNHRLKPAIQNLMRQIIEELEIDYSRYRIQSSLDRYMRPD